MSDGNGCSKCEPRLKELQARLDELERKLADALEKLAKATKTLPTVPSRHRLISLNRFVLAGLRANEKKVGKKGTSVSSVPCLPMTNWIG